MRNRHPVACASVEQHPALGLVGPIDETGGVFAHAFYPAGADRTITIRLASGRYRVLLEILSTGDHDLHTVVPSEP